MAVTLYTTAYEPSSSGGYLPKTVNAQAITDINANNDLKIMLMYENDFIGDASALYTPTTSGGFVNTDGGQIHMSEKGGTSIDPKLVVTYSDTSVETHYADGSGNFDDMFLRSNPTTSEAAILAKRNATDADAETDTGVQGTVGNYKVFTSAYMARLIFRFPTNASKTALSAVLHLSFLPDVTAGFTRASWQDKGVYVCKMSSDVSSDFGTEDWSHVFGWESSGTYAAEEESAVVENATFFGANF